MVFHKSVPTGHDGSAVQPNVISYCAQRPQNPFLLCKHSWTEVECCWIQLFIISSLRSHFLNLECLLTIHMGQPQNVKPPEQVLNIISRQLFARSAKRNSTNPRSHTCTPTDSDGFTSPQMTSTPVPFELRQNTLMRIMQWILVLANQWMEQTMTQVKCTRIFRIFLYFVSALKKQKLLF